MEGRSKEREVKEIMDELREQSHGIKTATDKRQKRARRAVNPQRIYAD